MSVTVSGKSFFSSELPIGPRWLELGGGLFTAELPLYWSDPEANIRADVNLLVAMMMSRLAFNCDALVVSRDVLYLLQLNVSLKAALKLSEVPEKKSLTLDELAAILDLRRVVSASEDDGAIAFFGTIGAGASTTSVAVYWEGVKETKWKY